MYFIVFEKFHFTKITKNLKKDVTIVKNQKYCIFNNWILQKMQKLDLTKIAKITKFAKEIKKFQKNANI